MAQKLQIRQRNVIFNYRVEGDRSYEVVWSYIEHKEHHGRVLPFYHVFVIDHRTQKIYSVWNSTCAQVNTSNSMEALKKVISNPYQNIFSDPNVKQ